MTTLRRIAILSALAVAFLAPTATAHEMGMAYLRLTETESGAFEVVFKEPARGRTRLGLDLNWPADTIIEAGPQGQFVADYHLESWRVSMPEGFAGSTLHIGGLDTTLSETLVRLEWKDGRTLTEVLTAVNADFSFPESPAWHTNLVTYLNLGVRHILLGVDHLLFVLGLLLIVPSRSMLLKTITAFTVAHSITLAIATLGIMQVPLGPLNAAIALSILFLGPEIVRRWRGGTSFTLRHPWAAAFLFGLLHGFGFASGLMDLGLARLDLATALLMFNVGVEVGQVGFVILVFALLKSCTVLAIHFPQWLARAPGYAVGSLGAFWTIQRVVMLL